MRRATSIRAAYLLSLALLSPFDSNADPLPVADQNPFLSGIAPPPAPPARLRPQGSDRDWSVSASFAWGSSAIMQANPRESLIVDAETREMRLIAQRVFAERYALRIHIPYRHTSAGSLDGFIDRWHDTFGLPEGARSALPEDALRLFYRREGSIRIDSSSRPAGALQGLGDVSVELGRSLVASPQGVLSGWLSLNLPTGNAARFTGNEGLEVTATLVAEREFAGRWQLFGHLAGSWLGEGDRLPAEQRDWLWAASVGLSVRAIGALDLTVQLDAHSAAFDSAVDYLGDSLSLSVGGTYRFGADWLLTLGISEDIDVETAPDVVFLFDLTKQF